MELTIICDDEDEEGSCQKNIPEKMAIAMAMVMAIARMRMIMTVGAFKRAPLGRVQINKTGTC